MQKTCTAMRVVCTDLCIDMRMDVSMCIDRCIGLRIHTCTDVRMRMCIGMHRHVHRRVYGHVC